MGGTCGGHLATPPDYQGPAVGWSCFNLQPPSTCVVSDLSELEIHCPGHRWGALSSVSLGYSPVGKSPVLNSQLDFKPWITTFGLWLSSCPPVITCTPYLTGWTAVILWTETVLLKAMEMPSTAFPSSHKRSQLAQPDTFFSLDVSVLTVPSHHLIFHVPGHDFWDLLLHNPPRDWGKAGSSLSCSFCPFILKCDTWLF